MSKVNRHGEFEIVCTGAAGTDRMMFVKKDGREIALSCGASAESDSTWFASLTEDGALRLIWVLRCLTKKARLAKTAKRKAKP